MHRRVGRVRNDLGDVVACNPDLVDEVEGGTEGVGKAARLPAPDADRVAVEKELGAAELRELEHVLRI